MPAAKEHQPGPVGTRPRSPAAGVRAARGTGTSLQSLQASAGNAAVAALVQRLASGSGTAAPVKPVAAPPQSDPRFRAVAAKAGSEAAKLAKHPAPAAVAKKAQDAAVAPTDDREAQAKAAQAE